MTTFAPFRFVYAASVAIAPLFSPCVEVNHCYNPETGDKRFCQVIYWAESDSSFPHVADWHMADKTLGIVNVDGRDAPWTVIRQRDCGAIDVIRAKRLTVTYTFNDPEEDDRAVLPVEARRPLGR